jgi:hypothetical protein
LEGWRGLGQEPSYGPQVGGAALLAGGPPGFIGALTGPIAILYAPLLSASSADASVGLVIVSAPIPTSRSKRRRVKSMICLQ